MLRIVGTVSLACAALLSVACGGDDDASGDPKVDCSAPVPTFSELKANGKFAVCLGCHDSSKTGDAREHAPPDVNFDVYTGAQPHAEHVVEEVGEGKMPPAPKPALSADDKALIVKWAACGAPE